MTKFEFRHRDCHLDKDKNMASTTFVVEREVTDINEVGPVFCPQCGKKRGEAGVDIEWVVAPINFGTSRSSIANDNKSASEDAAARASAAQAALDREDPVVRVAPPKGQYVSPYGEPGGATMRKSTHDKIMERVGAIVADDIPQE